MSPREQHDWVIILAGGEGSRLAPLTEAIYGYRIPKQFAALSSEKTFLQETLDRTLYIAPAKRTVVVVPEEYETLAERQLEDYPGVEIVSQPENRGTAPGVMLPLLHVMVRDPLARVALFPSDHYVRRPTIFLDAVDRSLRVAAGAPASLILVGAEPEYAATDLGWILPDPEGLQPEGANEVLRFVEKPDAKTARSVMNKGGLWNTMVTVARAQALWRLCQRHVGDQAAIMEPYKAVIGTPEARRVLQELYLDMTPADFSKQVVQRARGLAVVPMGAAGWSDCGTPERLFECLAGTPALSRLQARLEGAGFPASMSVAQAAVAFGAGASAA